MTTRQEQMELAAINRVAESISQVGVALNRLCDIIENKEKPIEKPQKENDK